MEDYSKMTADQLVNEIEAAIERRNRHVETLKRLSREDEERVERARKIIAKPVYQD